jgi:hypothetical protein
LDGRVRNNVATLKAGKEDAGAVEIISDETERLIRAVYLPLIVSYPPGCSMSKPKRSWKRSRCSEQSDARRERP